MLVLLEISAMQVKLEAKLAVGYDPKTITVEKAQKFNPRWIILDRYLLTLFI